MTIKVNETVYHVEVDAGNPGGMLPASLGMSKGDLIAFEDSGAPVRLPVGTTGSFLMADASAASGLRYANPAASGLSVTTELKNATGAAIPAGTVLAGKKGSAADPYLYMEKAAHHSAGQLYVLSADCAASDVGVCYFAPGSVAYVLCDSTAVAVGDALVVSTTDGVCTSIGAAGIPTVGMALSAKASGSAGLVKCRLCENNTLEITNSGESGTSRGTCYKISGGANGVPAGSGAESLEIPAGVQANPSATASGNLILFHKDGEEAAVMANAAAVAEGDWLVPSSTTGQVEPGSGYGIGYALGSKEAGSAGLVKCLLKPGQYGRTLRYWWLTKNIEDADVAAVWEFAGAASEAAALANVNKGTAYSLSKIAGTEEWDEDEGFLIPATASAGLTNTDVLAMAADILSAIFVFSNINTSATYIQAGGIALSQYRMLQIAPQGGADAQVTGAANQPAMNQHKTSTALWGSGENVGAGMLGACWKASGGDLYLDGTAQTRSNTGKAVASVMTNALGVIRQNSGTLTFRQGFYVKAAALYKKELTAEDFAEIYRKYSS